MSCGGHFTYNLITEYKVALSQKEKWWDFTDLIYHPELEKENRLSEVEQSTDQPEAE